MNGQAARTGGGGPLNQDRMAWRGPPDKAAVVEFARRETAPEHYHAFEPITRGPAFAMAMLIFLGLLAGVLLVAGKAAALLEKKWKWGAASPST